MFNKIIHGFNINELNDVYKEHIMIENHCNKNYRTIMIITADRCYTYSSKINITENTWKAMVSLKQFSPPLTKHILLCYDNDPFSKKILRLHQFLFSHMVNGPKRVLLHKNSQVSYFPIHLYAKQWFCVVIWLPTTL